MCIPANEACSQNFERVEAEFRSSCKKKRAELIARIKHLQDPAQSLEQDIEQLAEVEAMYEAESQKLRSARKVRALRLLQVTYRLLEPSLNQPSLLNSLPSITSMVLGCY